MEDRYSAVRTAGLAPSTTMLVVKAVCADEVRRIPILNKELTFEELCFMMHRLFRDRLSNKVENLVLKYTDADGDLVTMTDSMDVSHALEHSNVLRVSVFDKEVLPVPRSNTLAHELRAAATTPARAASLRQTLEELRRSIDSALAALTDISKEVAAPRKGDAATTQAGAATGAADDAAGRKADAPKPAQHAVLSTADIAELVGSTAAAKAAAALPASLHIDDDFGRARPVVATPVTPSSGGYNNTVQPQQQQQQQQQPAYTLQPAAQPQPQQQQSQPAQQGQAPLQFQQQPYQPQQQPPPQQQQQQQQFQGHPHPQQQQLQPQQQPPQQQQQQPQHATGRPPTPSNTTFAPAAPSNVSFAPMQNVSLAPASAPGFVQPAAYGAGPQRPPPGQQPYYGAPPAQQQQQPSQPYSGPYGGPQPQPGSSPAPARPVYQPAPGNPGYPGYQ